MPTFAHELGGTATDQITGFVGMIVGRSEWTTGCRTYCLCPKLAKDGSYRESQWFDEERIHCEVATESAACLRRAVNRIRESVAGQQSIGGPISRSMPKK